ncbi:MAG: phosphate transport system substrate-binding protein [Rhodothermales bacterium]|jgi:phosphate transport system substrate-binding protein
MKKPSPFIFSCMWCLIFPGGLAIAQNEVPLTPAEFVSQAVNSDEPAKAYSGSAKERRIRLAERAASRYDFEFDLSGLPEYEPRQMVEGKLRVWGNNYVGDSGLAQQWQDAFTKFHPGIEFEWVLPTAAVAASGLFMGQADVSINHELTFYDNLVHLRILGYEPTGFSVVTGSLDISGWQNSLTIIVHKDNPLEKISIEQLDGVFGSQRAGGWAGTNWVPDYARGPETNIRTWGQLGLDDDWINRPINTYGYSLRYATSLEFSNKVLHASDKWNENLLAFGNYISPEGVRSLQAEQIMEHLQNDPQGMAYIRWQSRFEGQVKVLALSESQQGPYYEFNVENLQARKYPLWGDQSFWVSVKPGNRIEPNTAEFIRFVLSREGQQLVMEDGKYLPLSANASKGELARLANLE